MALSLDTGVPWVMCQQSDAPDPIVSYLFLLLGILNDAFYALYVTPIFQLLTDQHLQWLLL